MKQKDYFIVSGYPHKIVDDPDRISTVNFKEIGDKLNKFNYNYDKDENLITLVGKEPESIAQFKFEDLDKGLVNKEAKDILDEYGYGLPSKYVEKPTVRIERKIKNVEEDLFSIKSQLKNTVFFDHTDGLGLAIAKSDKSQSKTLDLIEKHNVLAIFSRSLNNLLMFKKNIQPQTGQGILHFSNPLQLLDRLELLSGSILAGDNGVMQEFSQIAHLLNQMKVITKKQLNK